MVNNQWLITTALNPKDILNQQNFNFILDVSAMTNHPMHAMIDQKVTQASKKMFQWGWFFCHDDSPNIALLVGGHLEKTASLGHPFWNLNKYILQFGQIYFMIWANTFSIKQIQFVMDILSRLHPWDRFVSFLSILVCALMHVVLVGGWFERIASRLRCRINHKCCGELITLNDSEGTVPFN